MVDSMESEQEVFSSTSAIVFALISLVVYWLFLRPTADAQPPGSTQQQQQQQGHATATSIRDRGARPRLAARGEGAGGGRDPAVAQLQQQEQMMRAIPWLAVQQQQQLHRGNAPNANTPNISSAAAEVLQECASKPWHVTSPVEVAGLGGSNILTESGLVAFNHTQANFSASNKDGGTAPTSSTTSVASKLRPDRAKILSRLCQSGGINPPPAKGATLVVSVSKDLIEGSSPSLRRALLVLGTFYNLVLIVAVDEKNINKNGKNDLVAQLRGEIPENDKESLDNLEFLPESVLPSHRILLSSTVTGRVALVRQLNKVAMVVDWDDSVETQLSRFGYKVVLVLNWDKLLD